MAEINRSRLAQRALRLMPTRSRHEKVSVARELAILSLLVLCIVVPARLWHLSDRPALEWDEPVYFSVASNLAETGELKVRTPLGVDEPYLYQPPLYFGMLAGWFSLAGQSLESARIMAALASLVSFFLIFLLLRRQPGGRSALVLITVIATDGWIIFTNRLGIIENVMLPVAILGLILYRRALDSSSTSGVQRIFLYLLAGALLGVAAVLKHTGLYFLLVLPLHWILVKRDTKGHAAAVGAALSIFAVYLGGMWLAFGSVFLDQYRVQFLRAFGIFSSRGSVAPGDLVEALVGTYAPFSGTIIAASASLLILVANLSRAARDRSLARLRGPNSLYLTWAVAAVVSFSILGLRLPQYFILVLIPLLMYGGSEIVDFIRRHRGKRQWRLAGFLTFCAIVVAFNGAVFVNRFVLADDNALLETTTFIGSKLPTDAVVLADEPIGVLIPQTYLNMDLWAQGFRQIRPDFIVTYTSLTQELPDSPSLDRLLADSTVLLTVEGFKETIIVFEVPPMSTEGPVIPSG